MEFALAALVVIGVLAFVMLPLVRRRADTALTTHVPGPSEARAAIYRELLELELDQKVGKLADEDYREQSDALLARAAALISDEDTRTSVDDQIEREIAAVRQSLKSAPSEARP